MSLPILAIVFLAVPFFQQDAVAPRPSFEVASIKPNNSGDNRVMTRSVGNGRFSAAGVTVKMLIGLAYRVRDFQILGGPNWINTDRFDIEAKAETGASLQRRQMGLMMQSLLADRFQLKVHAETKELPVYELVVAKDGAKLQAAPEPERPGPRAAPRPQPTPGGRPEPGSIISSRRGDVSGYAIPLATLIEFLSQTLGRTIVDRTGITGFFDIMLQWAPDPGEFSPGPDARPPVDPSGPSIFTALQEQLGLRLESSKGPVEVIVIDSVEKPSEN